MTLRRQVQLMIAIPLFALIAYGGYRGWNNWMQYERSQYSQAQAQKSIKLTNLVHRLQVERGQSAGYLASKGKNFTTELPENRALVDTEMFKLVGVADDMLALLQELPSVREQVWSQTIDVPTMARFYTGTINQILEEVNHELVEQESGDLAQIGGGLIALAYAKEAAGLQRAAGAGGFAKGTFALPVYKSYLSNGAKESQQLVVARSILGRMLEGVDEHIDAGLKSSGIQSVRDAVLSAGPEGEVPDLTAPAWFKISTNWIGELREVEVAGARHLIDLADAEARAAWNELVITAIVTAAVALASILLSWRFVRSFVSRMNDLQANLDKISRKEFDFDMTFLNDKSEIGAINQALDHTRRSLKDAEDQLANIEASRIADRGKVIGKLDEHLGRLSNRDLDCTIHDAFPEEYETLRASFNQTVITLRQTIQEVMTVSSSIMQSAQGFVQSAHDLSTRTVSQSATLEEAAAALEQMTSSVKSTSEGADTVESTVISTQKDAQASDEVVRNAVDSMGTIAKFSDEITQITEVIDDIAFQTNLLALNAGVEAARAGSAGKGFAVVAAEVQGLAQRSSHAATDIKSLIGNSVSQVKNGTDAVGRTGEMLSSVTKRVNDISRLISEIAQAASQQATGLDEINNGIGELDRVTQQNAAMVNESTTAGEKVNVEAERLVTLMGQFNIGTEKHTGQSSDGDWKMSA